ncbi:hypothetical protein ACFUCV_06085 [Specibacter sp. NPDC057265]|uniref:hypothetical protein n=1 Tax=Specibacter sp. NPDC057265 TaxID=3346075 RepID=UPI003625F575
MSETEIASKVPAGASAGVCLAWLILNSPQWVHRRVEALRMGENGRSRWHISHDLTVPAEFSIPGSKNRMVVPLGSLRKGALKNVDTSGAGSTSLSILGAADNGDYAVAMLLMMAESLLGPEIAGASQCSEVLTNMVRATAGGEEEAKLEFTRWLAGSVASLDPRSKGSGFEQRLDFFQEFASQFAATFLLLIEIDASLAGTRCVIKYSRDDAAPERLDAASQQLAWEIPDYGFARSYHLEVQVPPGLVYTELEILELDSNGELSSRVVDAPHRPQVLAHVACTPHERMASAVAGLTLSPAKQGQYQVAGFSAVTVFVMSVLAWLSSLMPGAFTAGDSGPASAAVSLLLTGPALLLSWFSRSPEHEVIAWIMRPYRRMLLLSVVALFMMAAAAAFPLVSPVKELVWFPVLFVQSWALGLFLHQRAS